MKLSNCEIRPGMVLAVCNNYGVVKASCCGLFADEDDVDKLPPVYPFLKTSNSSFSEPQIGDLIWILIDSSNPQCLFYVFQGDAYSQDADVLEAGYDDCEIVSKRGDGMMMWSDGGWDISQNNTNINIDDEGVHMTTGGDEQPAVLGNELLNTMQSIVSLLQDVANAAAGDPHTSTLSLMINKKLPGINSSLSNILSKKHTLD